MKIRIRRGPLLSKSWLSATVLAFLLLSPFSIAIFDIGGSYLFEAPFALSVCFCLLWKDSLTLGLRMAIRKRIRTILFAGSVLVCLFLVGALVGGDPAASYADFRAAMMSVLGYCIARHYKEEDSADGLIKLSAAVIMLFCAQWIIQQYTGKSLSPKFSSPYFAAIVGIIFSIRDKRPVITYALLGAMGFLCAVSFYRQYLLYFVFALVYVIFSLRSRDLRGRDHRRYLIWLLIAAAVGSIPLAFKAENIVKYYLEDESRYIQFVGKLQDASDTASGISVADSDSLRMEYIKYAGEKVFEWALPHGFGYKTTFDNIDPNRLRYGITIDSLLFFGAYHYGTLLTLTLMAWLARSYLREARKKGLVRATSIYAAFTVTLLFDGGQAVIIAYSVWLGAMIATLTIPVKFRTARTPPHAVAQAL